MAVRLLDLDPRWWTGKYRDSAGAEQWSTFPVRRRGMGVSFNCPLHGEACAFGPRLAVAFENPLDGLPRAKEGSGANRDVYWTRTGETFAELTLTPSIDWKEEGGASHWHGHLQGGVLTP